jgi:hypothetical protein
MNKEFIPYEEALALKELGFDEPCFTWYWDDIGLYNGLEYGNHNKREHVVSAPTFSQAFRWFREKYDLHNGIYPYYDEYEYQIKDFRLPTNTPINGGLMKYEEAELACLKKLIKIVKTKKYESNILR